MVSLSADILVVGGGIQGCSTALHLARRGADVLLVEKNSCGRHASGVNAGGVRRLMRHPAEVPLSLESMRMWHNIVDLVGADCGFKISGQVAVAADATEWEILRARAAKMQASGWTHEELIGSEELYEVLPALVPGCLGGLIAREDGFASPFLTTRAFCAAAQRAGARIVEGVRAETPRRQGGRWHLDSSAGPIEARVLVNCGGAWGATIAAALGEMVPLVVDSPMMMVTLPMPHFCDPVVIGVNRKLSFKQAQNGTVLIGGGHRGEPDLAGETSTVEFRNLIKSAAIVSELFPALRGARIAHSWSGIASTLPDGIPVIGPSMTEPEAFHGFGFCHHGFQLGPVVGRILSDLVLDGASALPLDPFRIDRFASNP